MQQYIELLNINNTYIKECTYITFNVQIWFMLLLIIDDDESVHLKRFLSSSMWCGSSRIPLIQFIGDLTQKCSKQKALKNNWLSETSGTTALLVLVLK